MPAGGTCIEVTPEMRGSADAEPKEDLALPKGDSVFSEVAVSVLPDDLRDLKRRTPETHGIRIPILKSILKLDR
jgi:hypothetical protein